MRSTKVTPQPASTFDDNWFSALHKRGVNPDTLRLASQQSVYMQYLESLVPVQVIAPNKD